MTLRLSGDPQGLQAERDRLEELLQTSDDWRALLQLKARRERGEELSSLSSSQLEALLLDSLAENPFYQRLQVVLAELQTVPVPPAAEVAPRAAPTIAAEPAAAAVDDLTKIRGVDAALMRRLHALDVWTYEDIADWWAADVHYVSQTLGIGSRISAQNWIEQAAMLSMARPGGPRQSKKAIAAAKAKAEAEAKAKAEAERLAAEAKLREEAEAKARAEAARIAEQQRIAAEAAAKKVAEAAVRIAAEAKAAAAARAEAEIAARARSEAERRTAEVRRQEEAARLEAARRADEARRAEAARQAETAHAAVRAAKPGVEQRAIDVQPIVIEAVGSQSTSTPDARTGSVKSIAAALPSGLEALMKDFAAKTPPAPAQPSSQPTAEINIPRPVAETIFKAGSPAMSDPRESLSARLRTIDAEVIEAVPSPKANEVNINATIEPSRPALNPSASIDDAIRSAMMAASERVHGAVSPSTELATREPTDPQSRTQNGQRGELLLPISREPSPEHMALKVRERRSDDLAEVIFDSTRYAAYRDKPEEANVSIVRRNRRDVPRVLPPPVPTAQIEARPELKSAGTVDRFLKALKGL